MSQVSDTRSTCSLSSQAMSGTSWKYDDDTPDDVPDIYRCIRADGRMLAMGEDQYRTWEMEETLRSRLDAMSQSRGQQINMERVDAPAISRTNDPNCCSPADGDDQDWNPVNDPQTPRDFYYPPCYCLSCARYFWNTTTGFSPATEPVIPTVCVSQWIANLDNKSIQIRALIDVHIGTLQQKWIKKTVSQRRQLIKDACPSMMSYASLANLLGELSSPRGKKPTAFDRTGLLTSVLNIDDLSNSSEELFHHLRARSCDHPSQHFFADFFRLKGTETFTDALQLRYAYGCFVVTPDKYGAWQTWNDLAVHSCTAVAAPYAMLTFESQSLIIDMLYEIVYKLKGQIDLSKCQPRLGIGNVRSTAVLLPDFYNCANVNSLFALSPAPILGLSTVQELALDYRKHCTDLVKTIKSDNRAFVDRLKVCRALLDASHGPRQRAPGMLAHLAMVHPYEKHLTWSLICRTVEDIILAYPMGTAYKGEVKKHKDCLKCLAMMLADRFDHLEHLMHHFCDAAEKPSAIVPSTFIDSDDTMPAWLERQFFAVHLHPSMIHYKRFLSAIFKQKEPEVRFINELIKEWITEVLFITAIFEALFAADPTYHMASMRWDLGQNPDRSWRRMYPPMTSEEFDDYIEAEADSLRRVLRPVKAYVLPSGPKDTKWHQKDRSARQALKDAWVSCGAIFLDHFSDEKYPENWLNAIAELVETRQEPELVAERPTIDTDTSNEPCRPDCVPAAEDVSTIPHHSGVDSPMTVRKMTKAKLGRMNAARKSEDSDSDEVDVKSDGRDQGLTDPAIATQTLSEPECIAIKPANLEIVEALFSHQQHASSVRWERFINFMVDAGTTVRVGEGVRYTFSGTNVRTGCRAAVSTHKLHPDPTLREGHLHNIASRIERHFGWHAGLFVPRK